jgi:membrane protein YdbS with pleckstrin-like domain
MYGPLRTLVQRVFQVSPAAPHVPPGGHGQAHVFRAALSYWRYRMLGYFLSTGFLAVPLLGGAAAVAFALGTTHHEVLGAVVGSFLAIVYLTIAVVRYVLVRLDYEFRWYVVTDRSLRIRQGILRFEETTLTFANVQNVSIRQGPIERWFGFANVLVETAGGGGTAASKEQAIAQGGHRGLIRGLENAEEVKQLIRAAVVTQGGAGLGDREDRAPVEAARPEAALSELEPALGEVLDEVRALRAALTAPASGAGT